MRRRWLACAALAAARSPWEASQDAAQCARLGDAAGACAAAQVGLHGARVARGGAPVFVVGAEHAGTRYAAWLLRQHPAAPPVVHLSFPSAGGWPNLVAMAAERPGAAVVWVARDRTANERSIRSDGGLTIADAALRERLFCATPAGFDYLRPPPVSVETDFHAFDQEGVAERRFRWRPGACPAPLGGDAVDVCLAELRNQLARLPRRPAWKSTAGSGGPDRTSEPSSSVTSMSIRPIFGRIDRSRRVLEARPKSSRRNGRVRSH